MGKKWGYARVSSDRGQSVMLQVEQLTKAGCHHVFEEAVSGKSRDGRAQLKNALGVLSNGDSLVVTKLDRLAGIPAMSSISSMRLKKGARTSRLLNQPFQQRVISVG